MSQAEACVAPDQPTHAMPESASAALRARALRVRWLAGEIGDPVTSDRLLQYAAELEAQASSEDRRAWRIVPVDG